MSKKDNFNVSEEQDLDSSLENSTYDTSDDALLKKVQMNPFKLGLTRTLIKLKNHVYLIPLLMTAASMIVVTFTMFIRLRAHGILTVPQAPLQPFNSVFFFFTTLFSILSVLLYMNANAKHSSSKKRYIMLGLFFLFMVLQIVLQALFIVDVNTELSINPEINKLVPLYPGAQEDASSYVITDSVYWAYVHIGMLSATIVLAIVAPIVQPYCKKIQFK